MSKLPTQEEQPLTAIQKKYEKYVENLRWHLRTNEPDKATTLIIESQIKAYNDIIGDLILHAQQFGEKDYGEKRVAELEEALRDTTDIIIKCYPLLRPDDTGRNSILKQELHNNKLLCQQDKEAVAEKDLDTSKKDLLASDNNNGDIVATLSSSPE